MLDFYHNGYNIRVKDNTVNILLDNDLIISYDPMHGEQVFGFRSPIRVVEAREALDYARLQTDKEIF